MVSAEGKLNNLLPAMCLFVCFNFKKNQTQLIFLLKLVHVDRISGNVKRRDHIGDNTWGLGPLSICFQSPSLPLPPSGSQTSHLTLQNLGFFICNWKGC